MIQVKVKKLHHAAVIPEYQTEGAACFDLHAVTGTNYPLHPCIGFPEVIRTGLSFEIPAGHVMLIFSRSGHGFNHDTRLSNCVGVIDSDYRGEVKVKLTRDEGSSNLLPIHTGDRIAQAMIIPIPHVALIEAEELSNTDRGVNGYGSTGK